MARRELNDDEKAQIKRWLDGIVKPAWAKRMTQSEAGQDQPLPMLSGRPGDPASFAELVQFFKYYCSYVRQDAAHKIMQRSLKECLEGFPNPNQYSAIKGEILKRKPWTNPSALTYAALVDLQCGGYTLSSWEFDALKNQSGGRIFYNQEFTESHQKAQNCLRNCSFEQFQDLLKGYRRDLLGEALAEMPEGTKPESLPELAKRLKEEGQVPSKTVKGGMGESKKRVITALKPATATAKRLSAQATAAAAEAARLSGEEELSWEEVVQQQVAQEKGGSQGKPAGASVA